ncbi:uncharacterized protein BXZ73DRAFT_87829 [Epithele typhae]|uniref:uncharacterized protein n=1 Tax=Epithele typhae TaxID=378194 RepID=UPI002007E5F7|nr:uncharacterized protein BXZ73DRAFT_87829 [Epithele typhae]KAH9942138.1 hypothetical protein BXZ73DRAFT_87829 [Epithele typhae]
MMEIDAQLAQLLGTMTLDVHRHKALYANEEPARTPQPTDDAAMSDASSDSEDSTYQLTRSTHPSTSTSSSSNASAPPLFSGCAYLQAVSAQIRAGVYGTTGGDFLETIFTHREALFAYPEGHRGCAAGFTTLARDLETRAWAAAPDGDMSLWHGTPSVGARPDWDGDSEAVSAFRNEAWVIANRF